MFDKLVDLLVQFVHMFQFMHIVNDYEKGVVLRFGRYHRDARPGLVWAWPFFVETVLTVNATDEPCMIGPQSLTTADGRRCVVSTMFVNQVEDGRKFLLTMEGGNAAMTMLAMGVVSRFIETRTYAELTKKYDGDEENKPAPSRTPTMSTRLTQAMQKRMEQYGVRVVEASFIEFTDARSIRLMGVH